jgi:hypothetical protein
MLVNAESRTSAATGATDHQECQKEELMLLARNATNGVIEDACRTVAEHYYGDPATWAYRAFHFINEELFFGELPFPLIVLGLTAHGRCLGWSRSPIDKAPVILIHPSVWGGTEREDPWGIQPDLLGDCYALEILFHECIHVSVRYRLSGPSAGDSSHNNPEWIAEVNSIAPLIELSGVDAVMSKPVREGKKIRRASRGNIPFRAAARFPHAVRELFGGLDYYRDHSALPF